MTGFELALLGFSLMLGAIFLRIPIAISMAVTGFIGSWIIRGNPTAVLSQLKSMSYDMFSSYSLSIVPMFLLMGQFATKSGMSNALFETASDWLGHRKGGCHGQLRLRWLWCGLWARWPQPQQWGRWHYPKCVNAVIRRYLLEFSPLGALWAY